MSRKRSSKFVGGVDCTMRVVDDHFIRDSIFWKNRFFFGSWKFDSMTKARYLPLRSFERERYIVSSLFEFFSLVRYVRDVSTGFKI